MVLPSRPARRLRRAVSLPRAFVRRPIFNFTSNGRFWSDLISALLPRSTTPGVPAEQAHALRMGPRRFRRQPLPPKQPTAPKNRSGRLHAQAEAGMLHQKWKAGLLAEKGH
jgi:hypothetical protein